MSIESKAYDLSTLSSTRPINFGSYINISVPNMNDCFISSEGFINSSLYIKKFDSAHSSNNFITTTFKIMPFSDINSFKHQIQLYQLNAQFDLFSQHYSKKELIKRKEKLNNLKNNFEIELQTNILNYHKMKGTPVLFDFSSFQLIHTSTMRYLSLNKQSKGNYYFELIDQPDEYTFFKFVPSFKMQKQRNNNYVYDRDIVIISTANPIAANIPATLFSSFDTFNGDRLERHKKNNKLIASLDEDNVKAWRINLYHSDEYEQNSSILKIGDIVWLELSEAEHFLSANVKSDPFEINDLDKGQYSKSLEKQQHQSPKGMMMTSGFKLMKDDIKYTNMQTLNDIIEYEEDSQIFTLINNSFDSTEDTNSKSNDFLDRIIWKHLQIEFIESHSSLYEHGNHEIGSKGLWRIESKDFREGGILEWNQDIRLRHLISGKYLKVRKTPTIDLLELSNEVGDDGLFSFVPIAKNIHITQHYSIYITKENFFRIRHSKTRQWISMNQVLIDQNNIKNDDQIKPAIPLRTNTNKGYCLEKSMSKIALLVNESSAQDTFNVKKATFEDIWEASFLMSSMPVLADLIDYLKPIKLFNRDDELLKKKYYNDVLNKISTNFDFLEDFLHNRLASNIASNQEYGEISSDRQRILREQHILGLLFFLIIKRFPNGKELTSIYSAKKKPYLRTIGKLSVLNPRLDSRNNMIKDIEEDFKYRKYDIIAQVHKAIISICTKNKHNQEYAFKFIEGIIKHIGHGDFVIKALISILKDNEKLLYQINKGSNDVYNSVNLKSSNYSYMLKPSILLKILTQIKQIDLTTNQGDLFILLKELCIFHEEAIYINQDKIYKSIYNDQTYRNHNLLELTNHDNQIIVFIKSKANSTNSNNSNDSSDNGKGSSNNNNISTSNKKNTTTIETLELKEFLNKYQDKYHILLNQIELYGSLCKNRNFTCIQIFSTIFTLETLIKYILDKNIPSDFRAVFIVLMINIHINKYPNTIIELPNLIRLINDNDNDDNDNDDIVLKPLKSIQSPITTELKKPIIKKKKKLDIHDLSNSNLFPPISPSVKYLISEFELDDYLEDSIINQTNDLTIEGYKFDDLRSFITHYFLDLEIKIKKGINNAQIYNRLTLEIIRLTGNMLKFGLFQGSSERHNIDNRENLFLRVMRDNPNEVKNNKNKTSKNHIDTNLEPLIKSLALLLEYDDKYFNSMTELSTRFRNQDPQKSLLDKNLKGFYGKINKLKDCLFPSKNLKLQGNIPNRRKSVTDYKNLGVIDHGNNGNSGGVLQDNPDDGIDTNNKLNPHSDNGSNMSKRIEDQYDPIFLKQHSLKKVLSKFTNKSYLIKENNHDQIQIKIEICKIFNYVLDAREDFLLENVIQYFVECLSDNKDYETIEKGFHTILPETLKDVDSFDKPDKSGIWSMPNIYNHNKDKEKDKFHETNNNKNRNNINEKNINFTTNIKDTKKKSSQEHKEYKFKNYTKYEELRSFDKILDRPFLGVILMALYFSEDSELQNSILNLLHRICNERSKLLDDISNLELLCNKKHFKLYANMSILATEFKNLEANSQIWLQIIDRSLYQETFHDNMKKALINLQSFQKILMKSYKEQDMLHLTQRLFNYLNCHNVMISLLKTGLSIFDTYNHYFKLYQHDQNIIAQSIMIKNNLMGSGGINFGANNIHHISSSSDNISNLNPLDNESNNPKSQKSNNHITFSNDEHKNMIYSSNNASNFGSNTSGNAIVGASPSASGIIEHNTNNNMNINTNTNATRNNTNFNSNSNSNNKGLLNTQYDIINMTIRIFKTCYSILSWFCIDNDYNQRLISKHINLIIQNKEFDIGQLELLNSLMKSNIKLINQYSHMIFEYIFELIILHGKKSKLLDILYNMINYHNYDNTFLQKKLFKMMLSDQYFQVLYAFTEQTEENLDYNYKFGFKADHDPLAYTTTYTKIVAVCLQGNIGINLKAKAYTLMNGKDFFGGLLLLTKKIANDFYAQQILKPHEIADIMNSKISTVLVILTLNDSLMKTGNDMALCLKTFIEIIEDETIIVENLASRHTAFNILIDYLLEYFIPLVTEFAKNFSGDNQFTNIEYNINENIKTKFRLKANKLAQIIYEKFDDFLKILNIKESYAKNYKTFCENFHFKVPNQINETINKIETKKTKDLSKKDEKVKETLANATICLIKTNKMKKIKSFIRINSNISKTMLNPIDLKEIPSVLSNHERAHLSPGKRLFSKIIQKGPKSMPQLKSRLSYEEEWKIFQENFRKFTKQNKLLSNSIDTLSNSIINFSGLYLDMYDKDALSFFITSDDIILKLLEYVEFWKQKNGQIQIVRFILKILGNIIKGPLKLNNTEDKINNQIMLNNLQATRIIISLILTEKEDDHDYIYYLIKFMILLLHGGNNVVQQTLYDYFMENPMSERFFMKIYNLITKEIERNKSMDFMKNLDERNHELCNNNIGLKIMRLLQLFCEGHYAKLQNYLRVQTKSKNNYDIVTLTAKFLNSFKITSQNYKNILQSIDTLIDFVQGPCKNNQEVIVNSKLLEFIVSILKEDSNVFDFDGNLLDRNDTKLEKMSFTRLKSNQKIKTSSLTDSKDFSSIGSSSRIFQTKSRIQGHQIAQLKFKCLIALLSLLEGNDPSNSLGMRIARVIPIPILSDNIIKVYKLYKKLYPNGDYNEDLFGHNVDEKDMDVNKPDQYYELIIENGFNIFILINIFLDQSKKRNEDENDDFDQYKEKDNIKKNNILNSVILDEFRNIIKKLYSLTIRLLKILYKRMYLYSKSKETSESDENAKLKGLGTILRKEHILKEAIEFFRENTKHIEIIRNGQIEKIYFPMLPFCKTLPKEYKKQFHDKVDRTTTKTKIGYLMMISQEALKLMKHEERLRLMFNKYKIIGIIASHGLLWESCAYSFNLLLNFMIILSYTDHFGNRLTTPRFLFNRNYQITERAINILGIGDLVFSALVVVFTLVKRVPVVIEPIWEGYSALPIGKKIRKSVSKVLRSLVYCLKDFYFSYYTLFIVVCILGLSIHPFFFAFQLFDLLRNGVLKNVVKAVWIPKYPLFLTLIIMMLATYYFTLFGYIYLSNHYNEGNNCKKFYKCFMTSIDQTFKNTGSLGKYLTDYKRIDGLDSSGNIIMDNNRYSVIRFLFDNLFILIILWIIVNMIAGIIIDTFGVLREEFEKKIVDMTQRCFICGKDSKTIDKNSDRQNGFYVHVEKDHYLWNYVFFQAYLNYKEPTEYNGIETYISQKIQKSDLSWFPIDKALCVDDDITIQEKSDLIKKLTINMTNLKYELLSNTNKIHRVVEDINKIQQYQF